MTSDLSQRINIGKQTKARLKQAGIDSLQQLEAIGSEGAFLRLQALDPGACINLLYALDGALQGVRGNQLSAERKQALLVFYKKTKK